VVAEPEPKTEELPVLKKKVQAYPRMVGPKIWLLSNGKRFNGLKVDAVVAEAALHEDEPEDEAVEEAKVLDDPPDPGMEL